jgi:hypothetical protein
MEERAEPRDTLLPRRRSAVAIYALGCGYLEFDRHVFFHDRTQGACMTIPASSYLLVYLHGRMLFDTDVHPDPAACRSSRLFALGRLVVFRTPPNDHLVSTAMHHDQGGSDEVPVPDLF